MIFSAANAQGSDPATVDTYRRLRTLRTKFESLLQSVSKQGKQYYYILTLPLPNNTNTTSTTTTTRSIRETK